MEKFNELLEFDLKNDYETTPYPSAKRIKLPAKESPAIRFGKMSKNGFVETHTASFVVYDGTLYLFRYLNGTTMEIEVAVVPENLRAYFTDVLKDSGYGKYF